MNTALVRITFFFPWDFYSTFFFFFCPSVRMVKQSGRDALRNICPITVPFYFTKPAYVSRSRASWPLHRVRILTGKGGCKWDFISLSWNLVCICGYLVKAFQICHSFNVAYLVISLFFKRPYFSGIDRLVSNNHPMCLVLHRSMKRWPWAPRRKR